MSSDAKPSIVNAEFLLSLPKWDQSKVESLPVIAFAGRSNVGKSSLLNSLTNRKQLARVSNTPGRTQQLNIFKVEFKLNDERLHCLFCDLPGYGYAKAPGNVRKQWTPMMKSLFDNAENLRAILVLLDLRHKPTQQDLDFVEMLEEQEISILPVTTKADKVPKTKRPKHLKIISTATGIESEDIRVYSSLTKQGRDGLVEDLWYLCTEFNEDDEILAIE